MTLRLAVYSGNTRSLGESLHLSGLSSIGTLMNCPGWCLRKSSNLMEEPEGAPLAIGSEGVRVPVRPYEIVSVRVAYPERPE